MNKKKSGRKVRDLNSHFTKEDIQMTTRQMKMSSLVIMGMQTKTTSHCTHPPAWLKKNFNQQFQLSPRIWNKGNSQILQMGV